MAILCASFECLVEVGLRTNFIRAQYCGFAKILGFLSILTNYRYVVVFFTIKAFSNKSNYFYYYTSIFISLSLHSTNI